MNRSRSMATVAALLACAALPAAAQPATPTSAIISHVQTVSDLTAVCDPAWTGIPRLEAIAYCQGFLTSAGQYHVLLYPRSGPARQLFCVPSPGPTIAESGLSFANWSRANPQHAQEPALDGMLRWAQASFPCPPTVAARAARHRS